METPVFLPLRLRIDHFFVLRLGLRLTMELLPTHYARHAGAWQPSAVFTDALFTFAGGKHYVESAGITLPGIRILYRSDDP